MLETVDLSNKLGKKAYKERMEPLELRLGELQREARRLGIPVVLVFEGWDAAGKGTLINRLLLAMDPRGFTVWPTNPPSEEERLRPFLWRFWTKTPASGRFAVFDRSWYGRILVGRVERIVPKRAWSRAYDEIRSFERQLADSGAVILKFFLHISKGEQKRRFRKLESNPATAWKVTKDDWSHHKQYARYREAVEDMLSRTDAAHAPWVVIEAEHRRFATAKLFEKVVAELQKHVTEKRLLQEQAQGSADGQVESGTPGVRNGGRRNGGRRTGETISTSALDRVDLSGTLSEERYRKLLKRYQKRIREIEHEVYIRRIPVVIVYEGWDAAGKGGNIRRLVQGLDPRGYEVIPISAPNAVELAHHYLWRFWNGVPKAGHIALFDRSWYGRVLVERVEGFCQERDWRRAYREINEMEEQWASYGAVIVKLWLHVSADEQLRRFEERQNHPHKSWKITDEDWRNREKWDQYRLAVDEMLLRTSTPHADWHIVESNSKWFARIKALRIVTEHIEKRLG